MARLVGKHHGAPQALLVLLIPCFVDGQFPGGLDHCNMFRCPADKVAVQRSQAFSSPGCTGFGMGNMFGFGMGGGRPPNPNDPLTSCCDLLHTCWQTCSMSNQVCVEEFRKCNKKTCTALPGGPSAVSRCMYSAEEHEREVSFSGCPIYEEAQHKFCECTKKSSAPAKRKSYLGAFYKSRVCARDKSGRCMAEKTEKLDGLVAKYNTPAKFSNLVMKLVRKFPSSVARVADRESQWMKDRMEDARKEGVGGSHRARSEGMHKKDNTNHAKQSNGRRRSGRKSASGSRDSGGTPSRKRSKTSEFAEELDVDVDDFGDVEFVELEDDDADEGGGEQREL